MYIKRVLISEKYKIYLEKRGLLKQFIKAKDYIVGGNHRQVGLKLREPKSHEIYYFRINRQFRAWGKLEGDTLKVFVIDDHQN